jgi:EpsI family protein
MTSSPHYWPMIALLVVAIVAVYAPSSQIEVFPKQPLERFPIAFAGWKGFDVPLEPRIVRALGADDYLSRIYLGNDPESVDLYIAYYARQRIGITIHSPKNCLPGGGWQPISASLISVSMPDGSRRLVNAYLVEKGPERDLVLYWYQLHGRIVASEYWSKLYTVLDAAYLRRTDEALVRIVTRSGNNESEARSRATAFASAALAELQNITTLADAY